MLLCCRDLWCCCYGVYTKGWGGVQRAKIFSCMWNAGNGDMWIDILGSSKKQFQRWSAWFEKTIKCAYQIDPMKSVQNPHETRILPNSRARILPNLAHTNVRFAVAKTTFKKKKTLFLRARFPVRRDVLVHVFSAIKSYLLLFILKHTQTISDYIFIYMCVYVCTAF